MVRVAIREEVINTCWRVFAGVCVSTLCCALLYDTMLRALMCSTFEQT